MPRYQYLPLVALAALASSRLVGCSAAGGGGTNPGGTSSGAGGNGNGSGGSGNTTGSGGSSSPGSGGSGVGNGGSGVGTGGSGVGAGGSGAGAGGAGVGAGGTTGAGGVRADGGTGGVVPTIDAGTSRPAACAPTVDTLSDFEEGAGVLARPVQGNRTGGWYTYADPLNGTVTPPATNPFTVFAAPADAPPGPCNHYALHATTTGHTQYAGVGATLHPDPTAPDAPALKQAVTLAAADGISFRIKSGIGTQGPVWFEMLTKETQNKDGGGTATCNSVDDSNTRGALLDRITSTWQTVTVPFSQLIPRYLPDALACANIKCIAPKPRCESPAWNPTSVLGFQFSIFPQNQLQKTAAPGSVIGSYDLWIDDVTLFHGDAGLSTPPASTGAAHPFPRANPTYPGCTLPTGAQGKFIVNAYNKWKTRFVTTTNPPRVQRPENSNDTVSEGIGYGLLIAVYMNDRTLFDGLWAYWLANSPVKGASGQTGLMTWQIPGGSGTALDADEDVAWALLMASRQWGGPYTAALATEMIGLIYANEIDAGTSTPEGGNQLRQRLVNPSYFAPAYYREFAKLDARWTAVTSRVYALLNNSGIVRSTGLVPAWCNFPGCTTPTPNMDKTGDVTFQYDAHRVPWRIGLDYCWNSTTAADARTYTNKLTGFFGGMTGVGLILDRYNLDGTPAMGNGPNSMSVVGSAAVGAMASGTNAVFVQSAYQLVLDGVNRALMDASPNGAQSGYSYYNATVGLLTLLTMTGNFYVM